MIKLVAIDLDGTLLSGAKTISEKNQTVLAQAKAQGVKIVLCTGRPLTAITPFLECLHLREAGDYSITFNGGLVQKNDTGEIVRKHTLTLADVQTLLAVAKELKMPMDILSDEVVLSFATSTYQTIYPQLNPLLTFVATREDELTTQRLYNKAVIAYHQDKLAEWIPAIPTAIKEQFEVIKTRSNLLEFMPKGVTKASGIALLAEELGLVPAEIMAIGDEENDLSMIEYAGIGVAMANATAEVKRSADVVTTSNEEDGVAQAILNYVLSVRSESDGLF